MKNFFNPLNAKYYDDELYQLEEWHHKAFRRVSPSIKLSTEDMQNLSRGLSDYKKSSAEWHWINALLSQANNVASVPLEYDGRVKVEILDHGRSSLDHSFSAGYVHKSEWETLPDDKGILVLVDYHIDVHKELHGVATAIAKYNLKLAES